MVKEGSFTGVVKSFDYLSETFKVSYAGQDRVTTTRGGLTTILIGILVIIQQL